MKKLKKILLEGIKNSFTLIELIVVIVILGILAAIVVPNISSLKEDAIPVAISNNERSLQTAIDMYGLDHNGKLPTVLNPTIENPQPPDYSALYPDYIRSKPEVGHYLIDVFGKVWGSTSIAPNQINYTSGEFSFKSVATATEYELLEYGQTETINGSAGNAVGKYKVQKFADIPIEGKQAKDIYRVANPENKSLLVSAIDKYGLKAAPVGEDHLGVQEGLPIAGNETFYLTTDAKGVAVWEGLQTHEILPNGTSIEYSFATSDNGKTFGTDFVTDISTLENSRYLKVKVEMKSTNNNKPTLTYLKVIYHLLGQAEDVAVHVPVTPIVLGASEEEKTFVEIIDFGTTKPIGSVEYAGREKIKIVYESSVDGVTYSPATPYPNELPEGRYVKIISTPERDNLTVHSPEIKKIVVHNSVLEPVESGTVIIPDETEGTNPVPPEVTNPADSSDLAKLGLGDYVQYGKHLNNEPITWNVVKEENGKVMLFMTDPIRDVDGSYLLKRFDDSFNYWDDSTLRTWLNDDFYNTAFENKALIADVTHDFISSKYETNTTSGTERHIYKYRLNEALQNYDVAYKNTTTDKVFLASLDDLVNYIEPSIGTNWIKSDSRYWLRDSYSLDMFQVRLVYGFYNSIYTHKAQENYEQIRAALYLESGLFSAGDGSISNPYIIQ